MLRQCRHDGVDVVDAAAPGAAADALQRRPQPRVVGQRRVGGQIGARGARPAAACLARGRARRCRVADEIDASPSSCRQSIDDLDQVAVAHFADRPAGQCLGPDVADAGAGADARETGVGDHGDLLAPSERCFSAAVI